MFAIFIGDDIEKKLDNEPNENKKARKYYSLTVGAPD